MDEAQDIEGTPASAVSEDGVVVDFLARYSRDVLETLLRDRTTGRNIVWADDEYAHLGDGFGGDDEVTVARITGDHGHLIKLRTEKACERQSQRTKSRAEVFTPSWLCNQMNNLMDEEWFGRADVFNEELGAGWRPVADKVQFPGDKQRGWGDYVRSPRLEITCGEAPFLCSRYDTVTGELVPVAARVGVLDRKLRVVGEHARSRAEWAHAGLAALKATFGYEYQGDNLLIARINVLETFAEHFEDRWGDPIGRELVSEAAEIVSWNLWQMDGLSATAPTNAEDAVLASVVNGRVEPLEAVPTGTLFGWDDKPTVYRLRCIIKNWKTNEPFEFASLKGGPGIMTSEQSRAEQSRAEQSRARRFYAVIGNPPYQAEPELGSTRSLPIYDSFMDESYKIADRVELVTPARFLFGSGQTNSAWNKKMLADRHLEVAHYEPVSSNIFPNVDIKGGVAITYRDVTRDHEPIGLFIPSDELRGIAAKVAPKDGLSLADIGGTQCNYNFTELYKDHPDYKQYISGEGRHSQLKSNALEKVPIFTEVKESADDLQIYGLVSRTRVYRYCPRRYIDLDNKCLMKYKVVVPASNGSGSFGEVLSSPVVEGPGIGFTQTFMCIGAFETRGEADNALKYVKSKFCRTLLAVLKTTQHNPPVTWRMIPLQDFTPASDIDWSKPIPDIDRRLYAKYGLDEGEIEFIESHVKEMD